MIINLEDAKKINEEIEREDLEAIEQTIRQYTNNTFQNRRYRTGVEVVAEDELQADSADLIARIRKGDTIQITGSDHNDGLYTVSDRQGQTILLDDYHSLIVPANRNDRGTLTLVEYPADVKRGVKQLLKYEAQTADRIGLKSRSISRMSESYVDPNAGDTLEGYPAYLLNFAHKYRRMRWD